MIEFTIKNKEELKRFETILDYYWMDYSSSENETKEIYKFYSQNENLEFIDKKRNNPRALALCLVAPYEDFLDKLLFSNEIKNKSYCLKDISHTISKNSYIETENVFKLIKSFETTPEIFEDFRLKTKKLFLESCLNYFASNELFLTNHSNYFLNFLKRHKINPYENKFNIIDTLIFHDRFNTLELLINNAKKDIDKEKIINFDVSDTEITYEMDNWLKESKKKLEIINSYKLLSSDLNTNSNIISRKIKI